MHTIITLTKLFLQIMWTVAISIVVIIIALIESVYFRWRYPRVNPRGSAEKARGKK